MIPLFLCWGSFLNVVAYRLLHSLSIIFPSSFCPSCKHSIAWYDNIPVVSFLLLRGKCRSCKSPISWLYPFIELLTVILMVLLFEYVDSSYWLAYFLFFSALIVTIRTDLEQMLISRYVTLYAVPVGWLFAYLGYLPISLTQSILGSLAGYLILLLISVTFKQIKGKEGMGQGDLELLAFIGSFVGLWGVWVTLMVGSIVGALIGITYLLWAPKKESIALPFGPFLALGAILFIFFADTITALF